MTCLNFVQEVAADLTVVRTYPGLAGRYIDCRVSGFYLSAEADLDCVPNALRPYVVFYQLLRTDGGLRIVEDHEARRRLTARRQVYDATLAILPGAVLREWFRRVRAVFEAVSVDTAEPDRESYRELFDRVFGVAEG
jgi:hypothetical protein